jgi:hypothetical protein
MAAVDFDDSLGEDCVVKHRDTVPFRQFTVTKLNPLVKPRAQQVIRIVMNITILELLEMIQECMICKKAKAPFNILFVDESKQYLYERTPNTFELFLWMLYHKSIDFDSTLKALEEAMTKFELDRTATYVRPKSTIVCARTIHNEVVPNDTAAANYIANLIYGKPLAEILGQKQNVKTSNVDIYTVYNVRIMNSNSNINYVRCRSMMRHANEYGIVIHLQL